MDETTRTQIILAAVNTAGPVGEDSVAWQNSVAENAARITAMTSSRSTLSKIIEGVAASKVFITSVAHLQLEKSSNRVLVTLQGKSTDKNPDGTEQARTERIDSPLGHAMAQQLKALKGHKVLLFVELQDMSGSDRKVRVITYVEDRGVDESLVDAAA